MIDKLPIDLFLIVHFWFYLNDHLITPTELLLSHLVLRVWVRWGWFFAPHLVFSDRV
jgi:hypothetical protein